MPVVMRSCDRCGVEYGAKRVTSKYCGASCRTLASRDRKLGAQQRPDGPQGAGVSGPVSAAALAELEAAGRAGTSLGLSAMVLAARLDAAAGSPESSSAIAAVAREFRAVMVAALEGARASVDPLDELRARRDAKRSAG